MSAGNQGRLGRRLVVAFVIGLTAGVVASLVRRHPASSYRAELEEQRAALLD